MSAISNHVGLLIALLTILLLRPRRVKPETAAYGSQRMCVPGLRVDYVLVGGMLLGVWRISGRGQCDLDRREMSRWLLTNRFAPEVRNSDKL
jgi:hypothetical protein